MSCQICGGGPKPRRFDWTKEADQILLDIAEKLDRKSGNFQKNLHKEFNKIVEIRLKVKGPKSIQAVSKHLSDLEREPATPKDRITLKWTADIEQLLFDIGIEMQQRKQRNQAFPYAIEMYEKFKVFVPHFDGSHEYLRQRFKKICDKKGMKAIEQKVKEVEDKLTAEDLALATDSECNLPRDLSLYRKYNKIGIEHGHKPLFVNMCCFCGRLNFGDSSNGRWFRVSAGQMKTFPVEQYVSDLPPDLPYKDGSDMFVCNQCKMRAEKGLPTIVSEVNLLNPIYNDKFEVIGASFSVPPVIAALLTEKEKAAISLLGVFHDINIRQDDFRRQFVHVLGEVNLLSKDDAAYRYLFGLIIGKVYYDKKYTPQERKRIRKALLYLKRTNPLFQRFYANIETVFPTLTKGDQLMIAQPGQIKTTKGEGVEKFLDKEEMAILVPLRGYDGKYLFDLNK